MDLPIYIPLVNSQDEIIGFEEKLKVHELGLLHRAFSILIWNDKGQMLIHQRALHKYHSPGLWTNACCGHPNMDESMQNAVERRLMEEMGITCALNYSFVFSYHTAFSNGLIENEIDHVYIGKFNGIVNPNPDEVADYAWNTIEDIKLSIEKDPDTYTYWFKEILKNATL